MMMKLVASLAVLLLGSFAGTAQAQGDGQTCVDFRVNNLDSSDEQVGLEKALGAIGSVDKVTVGKDGKVSLLLRQKEEEVRLRLSEIRAAVKKAGGEVEVSEDNTDLVGCFRIEVAGFTLDSQVLTGQVETLEDIKSVEIRPSATKTVQWTVTVREKKKVALVTVLRTINGLKIAWDDIDVIWVCAPKKVAPKQGGC